MSEKTMSEKTKVTPDPAETISGYEFLAEIEAALGAAEVARIERLGAYRTFLQIRVDDDPHEACLFRQDFVDVWAVAAGTAAMTPREA